MEATNVALKDGIRLLEIEFPPLPASVLELDDVSAYDVAQATLKLAIEFAKGVVGQDLLLSVGNNNSNSNNSNSNRKKVAIMLPDESEAKIAIENYMGGTSDGTDVPATVEVSQGVTISSLRRSEEGDDRLIKVRYTLLG